MESAMETPAKSSLEALQNASRSVVGFSGHGKSLGAAGYRHPSDHPENCEFLEQPGQNICITPGSNGFESIVIGLAWDNIEVKDSSLIGKMLKKARKVGVDLDIGCLYEMQDGTRGAIQAFGEKFGSYDDPPFIALSGDERTGDTEGYDEFLLVNGSKWENIKRAIIYIYIYDGVPSWAQVKPQLVVDVPGENDFYVTLTTYDDNLCLCAVGEIENVRGGIKLTNRTEYFRGHEEMDRAFGFGLDWQDGQKPKK